MAITLHWWLIPLFFVAAAVYVLCRHEDGSFHGPRFSEAADAAMALGFIGMAVAVVIGHFTHA